MTDRQINYAQALYEATVQEMERDDSVFVLGLGVDDPKGIYGTTLDLHQRFGRERCFDTPLAEDAMTGVAIGAAMAGQRPIHVHQRMDFLLLCMNQLVNIAAKYRYVFAGQVSVPLVVRGVVGRSWGQGAQHSQALHAMFMHVPGLKVVAPVTPHDAKGCLIAAIRDNDPVVMMEHRMLYRHVGIVPEQPYTVPVGKARVLAPGSDVTIVAISHMVVESVRARAHLASVGISAEIIDPVWLAPLDIETIHQSVEKTGRLVVVDAGWTMCGAAAEIVALLAERGLRNPPIRMGMAPAPCPTTKPLENLYYPNARTIAATVYDMVAGKHTGWRPEGDEAPEISEFKGPF